jgi:hypothetical protein
VYLIYAQDSFTNPFSFTYNIEYSTEYTDSIYHPDETKIEVRYDKNKRLSVCRILFNGNIKYSGYILDTQLNSNNQTYILEKYFDNKYDACLSITKNSELADDQKVAMIYFANLQEDPSPNKTCICMFLKDEDFP